MANAKKCDRCGKYYDEPAYTLIVNGSIIFGLGSLTRMKNYDICACCKRDFIEFMSTNVNKKEEKDD